MRWMWIDRILEFEPDRRMSAIKNVSLAEDHLHDHFPADAQGDALPLMPASLMIEGMAQTAGILVGSVNRFREKVILAKISRAVIERDVYPGQSLRYDAEIEHVDAGGAQTRGTVWLYAQPGAAAEQIGEIDILFSHIDHNMKGLGFPEENFVFSDNFRTILRSAGLESLIEA